jgi:tRNA pseudouridine55 synthase
MTSGFLAVDKPLGWSSFQVVGRLRKVTGVKKIGHAGTLDPFATGLLIVAIGREYTRQIDRFMAAPKTYHVQFVCGIDTDSGDCEGAVKAVQKPQVSEGRIREVIERSCGTQLQKPPLFSAKKVDGKRAYEIARVGGAVELEPVEITIYDATLDHIHWTPFPLVSATVRCSKGTYIRQLVKDWGRALGCGAYAKDLQRSRIGGVDIDLALPADRWTLPDINANLYTHDGTDQFKRIAINTR